MEYTSDSDLSEDTRDLVSRGLASVKRKQKTTNMQSDGVHERFLDFNMDTSNVRHPSGRGVSIGDTSIQGLAAAGVETATSQNHNNARQMKGSPKIVRSMLLKVKLWHELSSLVSQKLCKLQ